MPITFTIGEDTPVLAELTPRRGIEDVSLSTADLAEKSAQALDNTVGTIRHMAQRVTTTIDGLARRIAIIVARRTRRGVAVAPIERTTL